MKIRIKKIDLLFAHQGGETNSDIMRFINLQKPATLILSLILTKINEHEITDYKCSILIIFTLTIDTFCYALHFRPIIHEVQHSPPQRKKKL